MSRTIEQLAQSTNPAMVRAFGAIRRFVVTLTDRAIWQIAGVVMPDGRETLRAELFGGVGFYARPSANGSPEAMVVMANGDATNPMIIAVRDEKTRQAIVAALGGEPAPDTTFVNNSVALVLIKPDGTIEARTAAGTAVALALKSDVDGLVSTYNGHTHAVATTGSSTAQTGTASATTETASAPVGTQKFGAE